MKKFASKRAFALLASLLLQAATAIGAVNITDQPESLTSVADAAKVTLTVVATSTNSGATFSYQWFKLNNTTSSYEFFGTASSKNTLVFASVKTTDAGTYKVVVTENGTSDFAESDPAEIIVNVRPKITVHPLSLPSPVQEGLDASFTVSLDASGATPFTYTWQKKVGSGYEPVGTSISKSELTDTLSLTNRGDARGGRPSSRQRVRPRAFCPYASGSACSALPLLCGWPPWPSRLRSRRRVARPCLASLAPRPPPRPEGAPPWRLRRRR